MTPVDYYVRWYEALPPDMRSRYGALVGFYLPGARIDPDHPQESFLAELRRLASDGFKVAGVALCLGALTDDQIRRDGLLDGAPEAQRKAEEFIEKARELGYDSMVAKGKEWLARAPLEGRRDRRSAKDWEELRASELSPEAIDDWLKNVMRSW